MILNTIAELQEIYDNEIQVLVTIKGPGVLHPETIDGAFSLVTAALANLDGVSVDEN